MFSWRRKAPRERRRRKHLGGPGGMLPQENFKITQKRHFQRFWNQGNSFLGNAGAH